jgi:hypothetical protein
MFVDYLSVAVAASTVRFRLPGVKSTLSVNFVVLLAAIMELSLAEVTGIAATAALMIHTSQSTGWRQSFLVLPLMLLVHVTHQLHVDDAARRLFEPAATRHS